MDIVVFDIEADGVDSSRVWCLSYSAYDKGEWVTGTYTDYEDIKIFFTKYDRYVCHNMIRFDLPTLEKHMGVTVPYEQCIDTLALSWWLYPNRVKHGLNSWGETVGVKKPKIEDGEWKGPLPGETFEEFIEKMSHRCQEDVEINKRMFIMIVKKLKSLYGKDKAKIREAIEYSSFKMWCVRLSEQNPLTLDIGKVDKYLHRMEELLKIKKERLMAVMPKMPIKKVAKFPNKKLKKDGKPTAAWVKWQNLLLSLKLDLNREEDVTYVKDYEDPNPSSSKQKKDWLLGLGWKPVTFKYVREDDGSTRKIPQLRDGSSLCKSVTAMIEREETVEELEGYSVLMSRIGLLKGFLRDSVDGKIAASAAGFTNTMRLKHKTLVNLPGVSGKKDYADGRWIRGCLTVPKGRVLCGSDITSLEDSTKQHYMHKFDPEYVKEMQAKEFDPHLDIAKFAGMLNLEQIREHNLYKKTEGSEGKDYSKIRKKAKVVNFSAVYGVGAKKLSLSTGMSMNEAKKLLTTYWKRNWAVEKVAEDQIVLELPNGEMWLRNPVNGFYYSLRYKKDIFSTLNQGTGCYVFDMWLKYILQERPQLSGQFHDEIILDLEEGEQEMCTDLLRRAMKKTNQKLNLNVTIGVDTQYGRTYADIH